MEYQMKSKWRRIGEVLISQHKDEDGNDKLYMKVTAPVVLRENQTVYFFKPDEKAPAFVAFNAAIKVD